MVEAAGVGLRSRAENKQVIENNSRNNTQETVNTRFPSTPQVRGIRQLYKGQSLRALTLQSAAKLLFRPKEPSLGSLGRNVCFIYLFTVKAMVVL